MKILVSIPCEHWIHKRVVNVVFKLLRSGGHDINIIFPSRRPYENNLNHIVKDFLRDQYEYWLNIDSDNPPLNNPLELLEYKLPVIGLPTPVFHFVKDKKERCFYFNGYDYKPEADAYTEHTPQEGLQKVDAIGSGCMIVRRDVLVDMKKPFERSTHEDGTVHKGVDIYFCEKIKRRGFDIYMHYDYPCSHYQEIDILSIAYNYKRILA